MSDTDIEDHLYGYVVHVTPVPSEAKYLYVCTYVLTYRRILSSHSVSG